MNLQHLSYFNCHLEADNRFLRGKYAKDFVANTGLSRPTFYRKRDEFLKSNGIFTEKQKVIRMPKERYNKMVNDAFKIAMIQEMYFGCSSSGAVAFLKADNQLEVLHEMSRQTTDRYLHSLGLSNRRRKRKQASIQWKTDFTNQVIMCDASPCDQVYMTFKGEIEIDPAMQFKDTHSFKKIQDSNRTPVWGFYFVDVFSKAYFVHYIACKGESAETWIEAFSKFFLHKKKHPMGGSIDMVYTDLGSGLHAAQTKGFLQTLNPEMKMIAHPKGNPYSKGLVEARIGGHKKIYERFIKQDDFKNIEDMNDSAMEFMIYHQTVVTNKFKKYLEGLKLRPTTRKSITDKNLQDARTGKIQRQVDAYRCVSLDGKQWLIPADVPKGEKLDIFWRGDEVYCQLPDTKIVKLSDAGPMTSEHPDAFKIPERVQRVNLVEKTAKVYGKSVNTKRSYPQVQPADFDYAQDADFIGEATITHSPIPSDFFTVKEAVTYIVEETGFDEAKLVEGFISAMEKIMEKQGHIDGNSVRNLVNLVNTRRG